MRRLAIPAVIGSALLFVYSGQAIGQSMPNGGTVTLPSFRVRPPSSYSWSVRRFDRDGAVEFVRRTSGGSQRTTVIRVEAITVPPPYKPTPIEVQATRLREELAADGRLRARKMRMSTGPMAQAVMTVGCWRVYSVRYSIRTRRWSGRPWVTKEETASYVVFPPSFSQSRHAIHFRSRQSYPDAKNRSPSEMAEVFDVIRSFTPPDAVGHSECQ